MSFFILTAEYFCTSNQTQIHVDTKPNHIMCAPRSGAFDFKRGGPTCESGVALVVTSVVLLSVLGRTSSWEIRIESCVMLLSCKSTWLPVYPDICGISQSPQRLLLMSCREIATFTRRGAQRHAIASTHSAQSKLDKGASSTSGQAVMMFPQFRLFLKSWSHTWLFSTTRTKPAATTSSVCLPSSVIA